MPALTYCKVFSLLYAQDVRNDCGKVAHSLRKLAFFLIVFISHSGKLGCFILGFIFFCWVASGSFGIFNFVPDCSSFFFLSGYEILLGLFL